MTSVQYSDTLRPKIREDITFSPPERNGKGIIYYLKDQRTNWFYRIGAKEFFLISRMDGCRTLRDIGAEYASTFGRPLNERSWENLFTLLEQRQLLAETANTAKLEVIKDRAAQQRIANNGLLRRRFQLVNPNMFLTKILRWTQFAFRPAFVVPALFAIVMLQVFVFLNRAVIIADIPIDRRSATVFPLFILFAWSVTALHEVAHGLACKYFGGSVQEIGIMWRYINFFPYCKLDDVILFRSRRHQIYTVLAGPFISFLCAVPFGAVWWFAPDQSIVQGVSASILIMFNFACFMNLIPFVELDGYFVLAYALGIVNLRKEAHQFWKEWLVKLLFKKGEGVGGYEPQIKKIYFIYGLLSLLFTTVFLAATVFFWFTRLRFWFSGIITWVLFIVIVLWLLYRVSQRFGLNIHIWGRT